MNAIIMLLIKYCPFLVAFAEGATIQTPGFIDKVVGWSAGLGGGLVAVFLIVSLVKDGIQFAKGQGSVSIWAILGKALFLILIIGLIFLALNYSTLGNTAKNIGDKGINSVVNETNKILP